jgi:uncharacterized protein YecT (DUF1311 family)
LLSMRNLLIYGILNCFFAISLQAQAPVSTATDQAQNSCTDYTKLKKDVEELVKKINIEYAKDPVFLGKFKKAQASWEAYRDAQLEMIFPESSKVGYGTVYPTCKCNWLIEITYQRFDFLLKWISNFDDGDVCGGSINNKKRKSYVKLN